VVGTSLVYRSRFKSGILPQADVNSDFIITLKIKILQFYYFFAFYLLYFSQRSLIQIGERS
jgi:hypothetical protein